MSHLPRVQFFSNNPKLDEGFFWATQQARKYIKQNSAVGLWYEAALPGRGAFCMRDTAHQQVGAAVLGLSSHTVNMLQHFARSISASRQWCGYWEIDQDGLPCVVDYRDDDHFWYNLPANFDLLSAAIREYLWSGDRKLVSDSALRYFYQSTVTQYVSAWDKNGDGVPEHYPEYGTRGLGSYNEGTVGMEASVGLDLLAYQHACYRNFAYFIRLTGGGALEGICQQGAKTTLAQLEEEWWDTNSEQYHSIRLADGSFSKAYVDELQVHLLRSNIVLDPKRRAKTLDLVEQIKAPNVETASYIPETLYLYSRNQAAYRWLNYLIAPNLNRREYPEVSFAVVGAVTTGLMGISINSVSNTVMTQPRLPRGLDQAELKHVPIYSGWLNIQHQGNRCTQLSYEGEIPLYWQVCFPGKVEMCRTNNRMISPFYIEGLSEEAWSCVIVRVDSGQTVLVETD